MTAPSARAAIPILTYHNIAVPPHHAELPSLYVSPGQFARQMRLLRLLGFRGISMSEALPYLRGERTGRVAVLTFDDGYLDNLENALPILAGLGFRGTCYVASGAIGRYNLWDAERLRVRKPIMSEEQLRTWCAAGMEVGAHTQSHPRLAACSEERIREEVFGSREDLEDRIGREVGQFCYPFGDYDGRVLEIVREAGYLTATTTRRGRARVGDDLLQLRRVLVRGTELLHKLLLKLVTPYEDRRGVGHSPVAGGQTPAAPTADGRGS